jgi:hypothetical protein
MITGPALFLPGCGSGGLFGLEDYQRDLLFGAGSLAIDLLSQPEPGDPGAGEPVPGDDGLNCWDLNGNGEGDPEEDRNGDGEFDALDCQGAPGVSGADGAGGDGTSGAPGPEGSGGADGWNCWDLNGNGEGDPDEDRNGDGEFDALDCQGADGRDGSSAGSGPQGPAGTDGRDCWDLNGNGEGDPDEDRNDDGEFDALDCQGADGRDGSSGGSGPQGSAGADGVDGRDGVDGSDGAAGQDGVNCWDLNGDGVGDLETEDTNGDGVVNVEDCRGADAASGMSFFDTFIDDFFTIGNGSYGSIRLDVGNLPIVGIEEPAIGACHGRGIGVLAYRIALPRMYSAGNPVAMRLFVWRTGPKNGDCFVLRLDAFRARHGTGVQRYGEPRFITLNDPQNPDPAGTLLVVDLPLNNAGDDPADGLGFPNDLAPADFLAFELNALPGFEDGGCYSLIGVEFFETAVEDEVPVMHAALFSTLEETGCDADAPTCDPCNGKVIRMTLAYTGEGCGASSHSQDPEEFTCTGDAAMAEPVRIAVTDRHGDRIYADVSGVLLDGTVVVDAANAGRDRLDAATRVRIFNADDELIEDITFHTSCSEPLNIGDQFGSMRLDVLLTTGGQGVPVTHPCEDDNDGD